MFDCEMPVCECSFRLSRGLAPSETPALRGFFGWRFAEAILMHHHRPDGTLVYDYPRVQFKVLDRTAVLLGLAEGAALLNDLWLQVDAARLGGETLQVLEAHIAHRREPFQSSAEPITYRFVTPWLPLNQDNHRRYCQLRTHGDRRELLERILVGNVLSLAKSFGYSVRDRLTANCRDVRPVRTTLKGVAMQGFAGTVSINFHLPEHAGIGKSVSRGFGSVTRQPPNAGQEGTRRT